MIPSTIKHNLEKIAPVLPSDVLLVAISGGVDSVALAYLCKSAGYQIELAHCNFKLRGSESERDEDFVRKLASDWDIPLHVKQFDTASYATEKQLSIQEAARTLRYEWFYNLLKQFSHLKWVLTGHHKDDQAETILMNFLRGTGLHGLTGIPARNGNILRPLLTVERKSLELLVNEKELNFVVDSSNQKEEYTRNYIRHTVMPVLQKVYPAVIENLCDNQLRFTKIENLYQQLVEVQRKKILNEKNGEYLISVGAVNRFLDTSLFYELLHPFGFTVGQIAEATRLLNARTGAQLVASAGNWRLVKHRNWLVLSPHYSPNTDFILVHTANESIQFSLGTLAFQEIKKIDSIDGASSTVALLDPQKLEFPLQVRRWRAGDYFYPLGMPKKKKVARFLIDLKLSLPEKEKVWVLTSGDKIVWVIGNRIDDRFKITSKSKGAIRVVFSSLFQS